MTEVRDKIVATYAQWTALSALRSGAPIKARQDIYPLFRHIDLEVLFDAALGPISISTFDEWHRTTVETLIAKEPRLSVGWATKIINVYLKTRCYIGRHGRHHLSEAIHPPIDAGLWLGLERRFRNRPDILELSNCVGRIKHIVDYECYSRIIDDCRAAARELDCKLIEVEQLWAGTEFDERQIES
jgi:hypothetical protein